MTSCDECTLDSVKRAWKFVTVWLNAFPVLNIGLYRTLTFAPAFVSAFTQKSAFLKLLKIGLCIGLYRKMTFLQALTQIRPLYGP